MTQTPSNFSLLIIEDEPDMANLLGELAQNAGFNVFISLSITDGLHQIKQVNPDVILTDLRLPDGSGIDVLKRAKAFNPSVEVVLVTGYASVSDAIEGFKFGLFDLITKPFETTLIKTLLNRLLELNQHKLRMQQMETRIAQLEKNADALVCQSPEMKTVMKLVEQAAPLDVSILITGETGAGKGVLARYIHRAGPNPAGPYFELNCAAVPENLVESELFGYEKGAFTGAANRKLGLLELANGGTLLLDEINSTRLDVQAKLLHFLQNQTFVRVGGTQTIQAKVRIVFASNQCLKSLVDKKEFREDLYYRINVFPIDLPPLRRRKEDIAPLTEYFTKLYAHRFGKKIYSISPRVLHALEQYDWPGNIRELENIVQRSVVLTPKDTLEFDVLPNEISQSKVPALANSDVILPENATLSEIEALWIQHVLNSCQGNKTLAAKKLGIDPSTLYRKLQ